MYKVSHLHTRVSSIHHERKQKQKANVNIRTCFSQFVPAPSIVLPSRVVARGLGVGGPRMSALGSGVG
jgi:hypothetical protein